MTKKIYEIGEIPELGVVPEQMYAWVIRENRLGVPEKAMQIEQMPVQKPGKDEVMVMVMATSMVMTRYCHLTKTVLQVAQIPCAALRTTQ